MRKSDYNSMMPHTAKHAHALRKDLDILRKYYKKKQIACIHRQTKIALVCRVNDQRTGQTLCTMCSRDRKQVLYSREVSRIFRNWSVSDDLNIPTSMAHYLLHVLRAILSTDTTSVLSLCVPTMHHWYNSGRSLDQMSKTQQNYSSQSSCLNLISILTCRLTSWPF